MMQVKIIDRNDNPLVVDATEAVLCAARSQSQRLAARRAEGCGSFVLPAPRRAHRSDPRWRSLWAAAAAATLVVAGVGVTWALLGERPAPRSTALSLAAALGEQAKTIGPAPLRRAKARRSAPVTVLARGAERAVSAPPKKLAAPAKQPAVAVKKVIAERVVLKPEAPNGSLIIVRPRAKLKSLLDRNAINKMMRVRLASPE